MDAGFPQKLLMKEGLTMGYIYNDEDNAPMMDDAWNGIHNPTVYGSMAEMKAVEQDIPFCDQPENGCWNCMNFDWNHEACTMNWNNLDESYYNPDTDDRKLTDFCDDWEEDPDADPECFMDWGNEP